ncbi:MAG TPA: PAS domain-containing protein [Candidatus Acidoferrum sp.]|nr:PAS domain-containing protein [Candidatus Acidoferrum sp.]
MSVYLPIVERASRSLITQSIPDSGDRRIERADLRSAMLGRLVDYWDKLRGDRPMPARGDLKPEEMAFALAQIMLVDIHWPSAVTEASDPTFRFRLVGSRIEATGHRGLTGRWAHELQPEFYRNAVLRAYRESALAGEPSIRRIQYNSDGNELRYERVVLPLSSHGTSADMLLVGTDWEPVNREFFRLYPALQS